MKSVKRFRFSLLLLLFISVVGCGVLAQQHGERPPDRAKQSEQTTAAGQSTSGGGGVQKTSSVASPFDSSPEAQPGSTVHSPFDAPPEASKVNATHSPFDAQSGASAAAPTVVVDSPFGSPSETPTRATPVNSPFDLPINLPSEAPASVEVDGSSLPPHEPATGLHGRRDEAAAEQPSHKDAARKEPDSVSGSTAVGRELFGDSYQPELSADSSPAFTGGGWSPWYAVRDKPGSRVADVDIAYGYGGNVDKGKAGDQPVRWALRNRSKRSLAVEYELNIRCAERCTSGWHNSRTVIPAGKSVHGGEKELRQIQGARVLRVRPQAGPSKGKRL